jgi:hypothetical protein
MRERLIAGSADPAGAWEMHRSPPAPALTALVREYVGFREESSQPLARRETPSEVVTLIVNIGVPLEVGVVGGRTEPFAGSFLARISGTPAVVSFAGVSAGVQVDMSPLGAYMLLDLPMDELPDPVVDLAEVMGAEGRYLGERLAAMSGWHERFDYLDDLFLARSANHLIRGFRDQIGVTPKQAGRIIRFNRAAGALRSPLPPPLAELAAACGYHDQSHMSREFRALAGTTPLASARARHPVYLGVAEHGVNFVQDDGIQHA